MGTERLDADALLKAVQQDEARRQRGQLKIFLGMCAGVGKTYAMLQEAAQRLREGVDVVVGYAETHGRVETQQLLEHLPEVPRRQLSYKGTRQQEMDLDAILERQPQLVLVDELAHSNLPGSGHPKRYHDVLELLAAGIDVYTTVNVQHLESRADTVRQITGVMVSERVPDSLLDLADEVALIDLSPEALLIRLAEGKVYLGPQAERAAAHFFQRGQLTALRELALRLTAERVDQELKHYLQQHRVTGTWRATDRLLVAVGPSPMSAELIRWTRRMAYNLAAPWLAVYVETGPSLPPAASEQLRQNLALAQELGAEVLVLRGESLPQVLLQTARQHHVTQLILGKPQQGFWRDLLNGSLWRFYRLMHSSVAVDVLFVDSSRQQPAPPVWRKPLNFQGFGYLQACAAMGLLTVFNWLLMPLIGYWSVALLFMMGVMLLALVLSQGPVLLAAGLSALLWNFFFIPPRYTFLISNFHDLLMCVVYFFVAVLMAGLMSRIRRQEQQGRLREQRFRTLYRFSRALAEAASAEARVAVTCQHLHEALNAEISFLPVVQGQLSQQTLDAKEWAVARLAYETQQATGRFTSSLPLSQGHYLPLAASKVYGVMGIFLPSSQILDLEARNVAETLCQQLALSFEREHLQAAATETRLAQISESLYSALLNSVSHELRTPLTTIRGVAQNLQEPLIEAQAELRDALLQDLTAASDRLNHLVANLLDMSRLQSGRLVLNTSWCDPGDILRAALQPLQPLLQGYAFQLELPADLLPLQADFGLLEQVVVNLLHNAIVHTPAGTGIFLKAYDTPAAFNFEVRDTGKGLAPQDLPHLFETFYRPAGAAAGGTGLGLSICKGIVEAHGGTITARNHPQGGALFQVSLPRSPLKLPEEE